MGKGVYIFYFTLAVIKDLSLMICKYCCPAKTDLITAETHCLYNQYIEFTKWQIMIIIEKRVKDF